MDEDCELSEKYSCIYKKTLKKGGKRWRKENN